MLEGECRMRDAFPSLTRTDAYTIFMSWINNCAEIEKTIGPEEDNESNSDTDNETDDSDNKGNKGNKTYWSNNGKYQKENDRLYKKYVPDAGKADSPQGNLLRVVSKIYYRYFNDGDDNLSEFDWLLEESPIPHDVPEKFHKYFGVFDSKALERMVDIAVEYCLSKEKEDIEKRPEVNAKHEERLAEKNKRDAEWKAYLEREKTTLSPIRKQIEVLDLAGLRSSLTKKNIKANKITDTEIGWIMYGIADHMRKVTYGDEEAQKLKNSSEFGKVLTFLVGKDFFAKSRMDRFDIDMMCKTYPRAKSIIAGKA